MTGIKKKRLVVAVKAFFDQAKANIAAKAKGRLSKTSKGALRNNVCIVAEALRVDMKVVTNAMVRILTAKKMLNLANVLLSLKHPVI
jgi:hypothetical protein